MEPYQTKVVKFVSLETKKTQEYSIVNKDGSTLYVMDAKLIRLLSEALRVQYQVLTPPDHAVGYRQLGGNWSGMLGMIIRSEADLAMAGIFVTEERHQAMNLTFPHLQNRITFMTNKPHPLSKNLAIFYPFSYDIWITLFLLFATVVLLFYVLMGRKKSLQSLVLITFGSILEQSLNFNMRTSALRMLSFSWILGVMTLTYGYQAVLLSFLSFPTLGGIRDIWDLSKASTDSSFKCFTFKGSYLIGHFLQSSYDTWRAIGECLGRNEVEHGDVLEAFNNAASEKAFVGSWNVMTSYANDYFISEDSFSMIFLSIPFSRKFCCPDRLTAVIHRIVASGLLDKILRDSDFVAQLKRKSFESNVSEMAVKLQLDDLSGAFYILMSGWLLSVIVFTVETLGVKYFSQRGLF